MERLHIGIDAGSVSLNAIVINSQREIVYESPYQRHLGRVEEAVLNLVRDLYKSFAKTHIQSVSFTGNHGQKLAQQWGLFYEFETISEVLGALFVKPDVKSIISMGGQDTALFQINHQQGAWELDYFNTNGPCASGTGSFIDQQAQRLATSLYSAESDMSIDAIDPILSDFIKLGLKSQKPSNVACRCTVFTKSDMIHLQNKGEKLEDIIFGLHVGNARNYMSTIVTNRTLKTPILFIGGLSLNHIQVKAFREYFPDLIVPEHNTVLGALGVALQAMESEQKTCIDLEAAKALTAQTEVTVPVAPRLVLKETVFPDSNAVVQKRLQRPTKVYLGLDIGSTTTKYAILNEEREILLKRYVPTQGKPIEVTQNLLDTIRDSGKAFEIIGIATTGSGRNVVGDFLNADLIIDEITAHARGAVEIEPEIESIFEIGGQDSKYVYIMNSHPLDFDMNKVCAAGTGSFLHELANKYGINIVGEFEKIALSSAEPVRLAERCTVFMESDLVSYHQKGVQRKDLIAGLCYAIVHNYLNRVVGKRKIGQRVMFLGGPSLNKGVVAAFENVLGRGLVVPKHREVLGAFGAAICVQEKMERRGETESVFRGLESAIGDQMEYKEKLCKADPRCQNQCKLKIYDFDGRKSVWGGECGRYEVSTGRWKKKENFFELRAKIWEKYMAGVYAELPDEPVNEIDARPTVGMQRALYGYRTGVLWAHFFDQLGLRLVLTPPTNREISEAGIEAMIAETCYPIKVSHGHVKELLKKTRYLFIPSMIDMPSPGSSENGYLCPLVQSNSYMVRMALNIDPANILNPTIHQKYDTPTLALEIFEQLGSKLGVSRSQIEKALVYALEQEEKFKTELNQIGREILSACNSEEPVIIVTGRSYNLHDEGLNLRLGRNLAKIGVTALPMDFIDVSQIDLSDFPNMYWGVGAQILRTARYITNHPNYFGLHLTNFSCGADSFMEHFYKHVMGDKAYLILELDEHSAVAGVMTRLEAYKNVIDNTMRKTDASVDFDANAGHASVRN